MSVNVLPWYYLDHLPEGPGGDVTLLGEEWHHCLHVLRMKEGESLILFDGMGHGFEGRITDAGRSEGSIALIADRSKHFKAEHEVRINIAFAPPKSPDRLQMAVEKIVELGVTEITFLECVHGEKANVRTERIKKIAISAAKQSRKLFLPQIHNLITPVDLLKEKKASLGFSVLCCHLEDKTLPLHHTYQGESDVVVLVGPEGGFAPEEIDDMHAAGAHMTSLGPHRLRLETAVITACANLHLLYDLKQKK